MWVELQQQHADVMQQWLASVCVPHLGQLPQVAQLESSGLGEGNRLCEYYGVKSMKGETATHSPYTRSESFRSLTL